MDAGTCMKDTRCYSQPDMLPSEDSVDEIPAQMTKPRAETAKPVQAMPLRTGMLARQPTVGGAAPPTENLRSCMAAMDATIAAAKTNAMPMYMMIAPPIDGLVKVALVVLDRQFVHETETVSAPMFRTTSPKSVPLPSGSV